MGLDGIHASERAVQMQKEPQNLEVKHIGMRTGYEGNDKQ